MWPHTPPQNSSIFGSSPWPLSTCSLSFPGWVHPWAPALSSKQYKVLAHKDTEDTLSTLREILASVSMAHGGLSEFQAQDWIFWLWHLHSLCSSSCTSSPGFSPVSFLSVYSSLMISSTPRIYTWVRVNRTKDETKVYRTIQYLFYGRKWIYTYVFI